MVSQSRMLLAIFTFVILTFNSLARAENLNITQVTMLQTLNQVVSVFSQDYAPFAWKVESEKLDLKAEIERARTSIESNSQITTVQFQDLLFDIINAMRDFHTSLVLYSTEEASLPFQVMQAGGKYFISWIDRKKLPEKSFPAIEIGREVVSFNGLPVRDVVRSLIPKRYLEPTPTEWRMAEIRLTSRQRALGFTVPSGEVSLGVKSDSEEIETVAFFWEYTPEYVSTNIPIRNTIFSPEGKADRFAVNPPPKPPESNDPAPRSSYVPRLGLMISSLGGGANDNFRSEVVLLPKRQMVGVIRIPTFMVNKPVEFAEEFGEHMKVLDKLTDALVIDLTRNGGGSLMYMYGLLSRLTNRPLVTLEQQIMISADMAAESAQRLVVAPFVQSEEDAKKIVDPIFQGLVANFSTFQALINNDRFILNELKDGRRLSKPTYFWGVNQISPHPTQRYTKPILVLIDELDFSGADFFPAILQDNGRAKIFGVRTAGAGGATRETPFPNQFNIKNLNYTWTIAYRKNGKPLENLGVVPDISYEIEPRDLQKGFEGYKEAVIKAVEELVAK